MLNRGPRSTYLHLPPLSSFQPPPNSTHLHATYFSFHSALCNTLNVIRNQKLNVIRQFPKFRRKISNLFNLTKNCTYGIFQMLISNPELYFWNCDPKIHFLDKPAPNSESCPFCLKINTNSISRISNPQIHFWANLG